MRRTYYTQDTSDYRTVSKKICSAQDTKKKMRIRARLRGRFTLNIGLKIYYIEGPYLLTMTFLSSC